MDRRLWARPAHLIAANATRWGSLSLQKDQANNQFDEKDPAQTPEDTGEEGDDDVHQRPREVEQQT